MRLDLELRHLYSVVVLAEEMHFTRASHRLRIAQPSLSKQLQQIERLHGVRLFARDKAASLSLRMQVALSSTKRGSPFSTLNVLLISLAPIVGPTTRL